jgi:hypothetical protein
VKSRMKLRLIAPPMLLTLSVLAGAEQPTIVVHRPTVVAFWVPMSQKELEADPGANEALSDFQFYASQVREPFRKAAIDFHEVYAASFRIRAGVKTLTFRPGRITVGYYLIAPGKKPRVEYGVETDVDLFDVAHDYFGIIVK